MRHAKRKLVEIGQAARQLAIAMGLFRIPPFHSMPRRKVQPRVRTGTRERFSGQRPCYLTSESKAVRFTLIAKKKNMLVWFMAYVVLLLLLFQTGDALAQAHSLAAEPSRRERPDARVHREPGMPTLRQSTIEEEELPPAGEGLEATDTKSADSTRSNADSPQEGSLALSGVDVGDAPDMTLQMPEPGLDRKSEISSSGFPLIAKITPQTPPRRVASLRLVEQGQELLRVGRYREALASFEKAIAVDSSNPYSHYFVARAHHDLRNYEQSLNFLDVAESLLSWHKQWSAEVHILRAKNFAALGFLGRADTSYVRALSVDPENRFALDQFTRIDVARPELDSPIRASELH